MGYSLWGHKRIGNDLETKQQSTLVKKGKIAGFGKTKGGNTRLGKIAFNSLIK